MTVKLVGSTSGSVSLQAPASTTGGAHRVLTLPDINSTIDTTGRPGNILQVVQTVKTDAFSVLNTTSTDITGMNVTITPASSNSKILILVQLSVGDEGNGYFGFRLYRGSTNIGQSTALDSANAANTQDTAFGFGSESSQASYKLRNTSFNFLDTPSTTSATTYKVQIVTWTSTTFHLNRPNSVGNARYTMSGTSTITALEIGA